MRRYGSPAVTSPDPLSLSHPALKQQKTEQVLLIELS